MEAFVHQKKSLILVLQKQTQNFLSIFIIMLILAIYLLMEKIFKFKTDTKNVNFSTQFCFGSAANGFSNTQSREISLNGNVYDFSVDYNSIDKSDVVNINKYLMTKNNIK